MISSIILKWLKIVSPATFQLVKISFPVFNDKLSILKESNALMNSVILYLLNKSFFPLFFNGKNDDSGVHALPDLLNFC